MTIATAKKPFNLVTAIKAVFGKRETPEEKPGETPATKPVA